MIHVYVDVHIYVHVHMYIYLLYTQGHSLIHTFIYNEPKRKHVNVGKIICNNLSMIIT